METIFKEQIKAIPTPVVGYKITVVESLELPLNNDCSADTSSMSLAFYLSHS